MKSIIQEKLNIISVTSLEKVNGTTRDTAPGYKVNGCAREGSLGYQWLKDFYFNMSSNEKKPSVMFIAPSAYVLGGLATWLDYMEPGLHGLGWEVTVGLVAGPRYHLPGKYLARHAHTNWHAIPCNSSTQEGRLRAVEKAVAEVKPDIVVTVNIPDAIAGTARLRQHRLPALKIAMAVHGIQPDLYDDIKAYGSLLDGVFCVNQLACKLAMDHCHIDAGKVFYVPCGVKQNKRQDSKAGTCLRIAYVGRLEQDQKRVFDLPVILAQLEDMSVPYELKIAGTGPDEAKLREAMGARVDDGRVIFLGFLTPEQLQQQIFEEVDALLLTSLWETGPIVVWEAMAAGVAVVSSRYIGSGLESALHHNENALMFPVADIGAAAIQLQRLWQEPELLENLRQAGFKLIAERYSIPVSVAGWDEHLRDLLQQPSLPSASLSGFQSAGGRLDRMLGGSAAESVRSLLGTTGPDGGAGGEWPHSHSGTDYWDEEFWAMAEQLDCRQAEVLSA